MTRSTFRAVPIRAITLGSVLAATMIVPLSGSVQARPTDVISGKLTHDGVPVATDIVAVAWPAPEVLRALKNGQTVPTVIVGAARSNSDGTYSLGLDRVALGPLVKAGRVDIQLTAADATRELTWNYTQVVGDTPVLDIDLGTTRPSVVQVGAPATTIVDASGATLTSTAAQAAQILSAARPEGAPSLAKQVGTMGRSTAVGLSAVDDPDSGASASCGVYVASTWRNNRPESFVNVYGWSGAKAELIQGSGTSHTMGIGFNYDGNGWGANGTSKVEITTTDQRTQPNVVDATARNRVNYRDFKNPCNDVLTKPVEIAALMPTSDFLYAPHKDFNTVCANYTGGTYTKAQGTNATFSAGVDVGPISVSAQSGYNTDTKITWNFTAASKLCGNTSSLISSSQLSARKA